MLLIIVMVNFISILGRIFFNSPLIGDFELVEMGCAISIFMFLPLCQLKKGNITIDFFTSKLDTQTKFILDSISAIIFGVVSLLFSYRMTLGAADMIKYNEQTMLLRIPVWIAFVPGTLSFALLAAICFYGALVDFKKSSVRDPL